MREMLSSVSPKGQVTIPVEIRRLLGVKPKDRVVFQVDHGEVKIVPATHTLESAYGSVEPLTRPEDFDDISRRAKNERARRVVSKMRRHG